MIQLWQLLRNGLFHICTTQYCSDEMWCKGSFTHAAAVCGFHSRLFQCRDRKILISLWKRNCPLQNLKWGDKVPMRDSLITQCTMIQVSHATSSRNRFLSSTEWTENTHSSRKDHVLMAFLPLWLVLIQEFQYRQITTYFSCLVKSNLVKLETSQTVILPPYSEWSTQSIS